MSTEGEDPKEEIKKAREYLKQSRKNLDRLTSGKSVKRKFRYVIQENKFLASIIVLILIASIVLPIVFLRPEPIIRDPMQDQIDSTVNLIHTNFTDITGLPFINDTLQTPTSELLILSSLAYSLITQAGFDYNQENFQVKIKQILNVIENNTFVKYENSSITLSIFYQFLGVYTLLQSEFALGTESGDINSTLIYNVLSIMLDRYFSPSKGLIVQPNSNSSFLIDQAMAIWILSSYELLTGEDYLFSYYNYYFDLDDVVETLIYQIYNNFFNSTTFFLYHEYDHSINESKSYADVNDLIFFTAALSKSERLYNTFTRSSYNIHQQIINDFVDDSWYVHSYNTFDSEIYIRNQVYFALISYLMNLGNVGIEVQNKITEDFVLNGGFINKLGEEDISCESCLYGLIGISSRNWSVVENEREIIDSPTETALSPLIYYIISFIIIMIVRKRKKLVTKMGY